MKPGDLVLGDRAYGTPPGVAHVTSCGGQVLVRINLKRLPLYSPQGRRISILARLRGVRRGEPHEWPAQVRGPDGLMIAGRLVAGRRTHSNTGTRSRPPSPTGREREKGAS